MLSFGLHLPFVPMEFSVCLREFSPQYLHYYIIGPDFKIGKNEDLLWIIEILMLWVLLKRAFIFNIIKITNIIQSEISKHFALIDLVNMFRSVTVLVAFQL
jgi:hypothetical protein